MCCTLGLEIQRRRGGVIERVIKRVDAGPCPCYGKIITPPPGARPTTAKGCNLQQLITSLFELQIRRFLVQNDRRSAPEPPHTSKQKTAATIDPSRPSKHPKTPPTSPKLPRRPRAAAPQPAPPKRVFRYPDHRLKASSRSRTSRAVHAWCKT